MPGRSFSPCAISSTMGKSMAATACSDMMHDRRAASRNMALTSPFGELPARPMIKRATLLLRPECMTAPERIKAPRIKKTASLPKRANVSLSVNTPKRGTIIMAKRPVTARGRIFVIQRKRQTINIAMAFRPAGVSPSGGAVETMCQQTRAIPRKASGLSPFINSMIQRGRLSILTSMTHLYAPEEPDEPPSPCTLSFLLRVLIPHVAFNSSTFVL